MNKQSEIYVACPVIQQLMDDIAGGDEPMLQMHVKSNVDEETKRKLSVAFEEVRPEIEKMVLCRALNMSGVV